MAEGKINNALSTRYDVSDFQTTVPPQVSSWCEQLASGLMYRFMSRGGKESMKRANDLIDPVMDELKMLIDRKINIVDSTGSIISDETSVLCNTEDYHTTFDEDDPVNWSVDSDKLEDIADGRE